MHELFHTESCSGNMLTIFYIWVFVTSITSVSTTCASNWQLNGHFCYTIATNYTTVSPNFADSYHICLSYLGNLPTFKNLQDFTDFTNFINNKNVSGVSSLGYIIYDSTVTNPNLTFTSMYDGLSTQYTNWGSGQPDLSFGFCTVQFPSMSWYSNDWSINPVVPVCQQSQVYDTNSKSTPCTPLCRSNGNNIGHRFTVDPFYCPAGLTVENNSIGYVPTFYVPGLTVILYEVQNPSGLTLMAYSSEGLSYVGGLGYSSVMRVVYVSTAQSDSTTTSFLLYNLPNATDSVVTSGNEYDALISMGWYAYATFYIYNTNLANGECSFRQNCTWTQWQSWSTCSATCGNSTMTRTRSKNITENHGGTCDDTFNETQTCNLTSCPINCTWNTWQTWSSCSLSCGNGTWNRIRTKNITEAYGGFCDDISNDTGSCNTSPCPIACLWNTWLIWSSCTLSCGNGTSVRSRTKSITEVYGGTCDNIFNETTSCNSNPCPINCSWNSWQSWSSCSLSCGNGTWNRIRTKNITEAYGGFCDNISNDTNSCNSTPCPINCSWNTWLIWSSCTSSCGNGTSVRSRTKSITEVYGGTCDNIFNETTSCNSNPCPINCSWNSWQSWSTCTLSCGNGTMSRTRTKNITEAYGGLCDNISNDTGSCNTTPCPINCSWNTWQDWSPCTQTCGNGTFTRSRTKSVIENYGGQCDDIFNDTSTCNANPCPTNCTWDNWQSWSQCSYSCGNGTYTRSRTKLTSELNGGLCDNVLNETDICNTNPCPLNCSWSSWYSWTSCSQSCNDGIKSRLRNKTVNEDYGGVCDNIYNETSSCNTNPCPQDCIWNSWQEWSNCSHSCGSGFVERLRTKNVTNTYGGLCDNIYKQTNSCNEFPCPIDCALTKWSSFGSCSITCGGDVGIKRRGRNIVSQPLHGGTPCPDRLQEYSNCSVDIDCVKAPMTPLLRTIATVMQAIGCSSMIGALSAILFFFLLFRIFNFDRILHMCQEISLLIAHILICFFAFKEQAESFHHGICFIVTILLQYLFLVYYTFLAFECMNIYCILTNVTSNKSLLPLWQLLAIGWGAPAILTVSLTAIFQSKYLSEYSCWVNWGVQSVSASTLIPILLLLFISSIMAEAANMDYAKGLLGHDCKKRAAALVSRGSMLILIPMHMVFWLVASNAIYYQNIALYTTVFGLNIAFAVSIFVFHVASNEQVYHYVDEKIFKRFKSCCQKKQVNDS